MLKLLFTVAATLVIAGSRVACSLYPNVAATSHATPNLIEFLHGYFTSKSLHNPDAFLDLFDLSNVTYIDATLGFSYNSTDFAAAVHGMMASWGSDGRSYPLRIIGDMTSAVVFFEDTPPLFGTELRAVAALDLENGKVVREIDYWDGRRIPLSVDRVPEDQYPTDFGESTLQRRASPVIQRVADDLNTVLSAGNSTAAAAFFSVDAIFEDRTTRTRIEGQAAIERYFERAVSTVPYGLGATVRHVLGGEQGGGYEWVAGPDAIAMNGISAIELDCNQSITGLLTVWNAALTSDAAMVALTALAIEP